MGRNLQGQILGDDDMPDSAAHLCTLNCLRDVVQLAIVQRHVNHLVGVLLDAEGELVAVGRGDGSDGVFGLAECGLEPLASLRLPEPCLLEVVPLWVGFLQCPPPAPQSDQDVRCLHVVAERGEAG